MVWENRSGPDWAGPVAPMPCKWYLIRLPKIRFGPCVSGSVRTFLVRHRRQMPSGMGATRLPRLFPLFAVLLRTALRFCNSAGEKLLCWAWHRAHCRYGYKSSTSVWGGGPAWQRRNQPYLDAPLYPAPLTAHKRPFDDVQQQSRICLFLVLDCSREKVQFFILRSDDDRLRRTVGRVNRILNKNRQLSFSLRLWEQSCSSSGFFRQPVSYTVCVTSISCEENSVPECCTLRRWRRFCWFDL